MKVLGLNGSPNQDGLTATMLRSALDGAEEAGATTEAVHMTELCLGACRQCDAGWGLCRTEGRCIIEDDLESLRGKLREAHALVIASPVYFGEASEVVKSFFDRLRRCEVAGPEDTPLSGRYVLGIAAAGGSGGGIVSCQQILERYISHLRMQVFDLIPVTRHSRSYKVDAARAAGAAMVRAE